MERKSTPGQKSSGVTVTEESTPESTQESTAESTPESSTPESSTPESTPESSSESTNESDNTVPATTKSEREERERLQQLAKQAMERQLKTPTESARVKKEQKKKAKLQFTGIPEEEEESEESNAGILLSSNESESSSEPSTESTKKSSSEPSTESTKESSSEPSTESTKESSSEASTESTKESSSEASTESSSEPSTKSTKPKNTDPELPIPEVSKKLWGNKEVTPEKLLSLWTTYVPKETDSDEDRKRLFKERNVLIKKMIEMKVFPKEEEASVEKKGWLYPDLKDPDFLPKLLKKREFADSLQTSIQDRIKQGADPCSQTDEFELTPVQRFISNFLAPTTPYQSALLYHGVGVGKTCAAVTIAEGFLEKYPSEQVYVIAPTAIQAGFKNEIFDISNIRMGKGVREENLLAEPNQLRGCTGDLYLKLSGTLFEQDKSIIQKRVNELIKQRYQFYGYLQLANQIEAIEKQVKGINVEGRRDIVDAEIRRRFNGRILIIDEAHNLRNVGEETGENLDSPGGETETNLANEGKKLIPYLKRVLTVCEGIKLVLLTGTPMYNSYKEIIFLMNLMLLNEKRTEDMISESEIFDSKGNFTDTGAKRLGRLAGRYVSFMRGEDPLRYPVRLHPRPIDGDLELLTNWVPGDPKGIEIEPEEITRIKNFNLPLIKCVFDKPVRKELYDFSKDFVEKKGIQFATVDALIQAGNWVFPAVKDEDEFTDRILKKGFCNVFSSSKAYCQKKAPKAEGEKAALGTELQFESRVDPSWMLEENLGDVSPKMKLLLHRLRTCDGCVFVYSRFVNAGSLPIAIALEMNGYKPYGRDTTFLSNKGFIKDRKLQCALCPKRKGDHTTKEADGHDFTQARYALMTGSQDLTPNNSKIVKAQKLSSKPKTEKEDEFIGNEQGALIKVIIGTKVAAEGIDFKYIREMYLFDGWYHLSKLEQVIGRGVRTCSHALLPKKKRNTTIYLLVNHFEGKNRESMDLWSYRKAINKAAQVGKVTRVLKEYALDCNLNHDAILISGLNAVTMKDSQREIRNDVNINDVPYTILCDWEKCDTFKCKPPVEVDPDLATEETYTEFAAKWQESRLMNAVRKLFEGSGEGSEQPFIGIEDFNEAFKGISRKSRDLLLQTILRSKSFRIHLFGKEGTILYKNGYFLFQPLALSDEGIPLALRMAQFPLKRDVYPPLKITGIGAPQTAAKEESKAKATGAVINFWNELMKYTETIRTRTAVKSGVPGSISAALEEFHSHHAANITKSKSKFEVISWFYTKLRDDEANRKLLADVVEESIWDEFLIPSQQMELIADWKGSKTVYTQLQHVFEENFLKKDATEVFRFVNIQTGKLEFVCDGRPCNPSDVERVSTNPPNTLADLPALTNRTTGLRYGFIMPSAKAASYIFKSAEPPKEGETTLQKGQECANNSKTTEHKEKIAQLGLVLQKALGSTFDLTMDGITIENAVRICYLMSLVLRFMDKKRINGKRWMYRSVAANVVGYNVKEKSKGK